MENFFQERHRPKVLPLTEIVEETPEIKSFYVASPGVASSSNPGQFLMLWVIGVDEIPMAVSTAKEDGTLGMTVERVGDATSRLHDLQEGDLIGIRGPYGNGFDLSGKRLLMVCGGCGAAPLAFSAEGAMRRGKEVTVILAAESSEKLLFRSRLENLGVELMVATEDGSAGTKGLATDVLKKEISDQIFDSCLICGRERMMSRTAKLARKKEIPTQISLNRYMKCGIGICGQCSIDPSGLRVCQEGPVFQYEDIKDSEFGNYKRDSEGKKVGF